MKGILPALIALSVVVLISGCATEDGDITLSDGMVIPAGQCSSRGIEDAVVVFYSPGCPACERALPELEELADEMPDDDFRFINLGTDREELDKLGLVPVYVPTVVIDCKVYVGARTKEEYLSYMVG